MEFADHLWLPYLDQPQSDIVVFAMITFQIYNILVTKWKDGIVPINGITFNEELNIYESSHEEAIVIFITYKDLNMTENNYVTQNGNDNCFELSY